MKKVDVLAAILLVVGGLNWGLVGAINFDLVAAIFGKMSVLSKAVYVLVGISALYQGLGRYKELNKGGEYRVLEANTHIN